MLRECRHAHYTLYLMVEQDADRFRTVLTDVLREVKARGKALFVQLLKQDCIG